MSRDIKQELVKWLDAKLRADKAAKAAIAEGDARTVFRLAAQACNGIREKGGNNRGPLVELLQRTIGTADGEAWCMAFVQSMIGYAEVKTGRASQIIASEHCLTVWNDSPKACRVKECPAPGAIVVWRHGKTTSGHTGVVLGCSGKGAELRTVEGNTEGGRGYGGEIVREGGGVYLNARPWGGVGSMKLVGFLIPFPTL